MVCVGKGCSPYKTRKMQKVLILPIVAMPAPLFAKIYVDTMLMHMPTSSGYKFIMQGRCSVVYWPEFDILKNENAQAISEWLLKCFVYRWGMLLEIVLDNSTPFVKAISYLKVVPHKPYSNLGLQFSCEWTSGMITLRRSTGALQSCRWRPV